MTMIAIRRGALLPTTTTTLRMDLRMILPRRKDTVGINRHLHLALVTPTLYRQQPRQLRDPSTLLSWSPVRNLTTKLTTIRRFRPLAKVADASTTNSTTTTTSSSKRRNKTRKTTRHQHKGVIDATATPSSSSLSPSSTFRNNRVFNQVKVTCLPGLEHILSEELAHLGLSKQIQPPPARKDIKKLKGSIRLNNLTLEQMYACHLHLGTASNILIHIATFKARALGELQRKVASLHTSSSGTMDWKEWILPQAKVTVTATAEKSRLVHTKAISERVLNGIDKRLGRTAQQQQQKQEESTKTLENEQDEVHIKLQFYRDEVTIYLDTSKTPLHRRGYRLETAKAPLREDIAFAMLYAAGWRTRSDGSFNPLYKAFLDPFCGSGTIAIEAAAVQLGLPPGRLRPPPLTGTCFFDVQKWDKVKTDALSKAKKDIGRENNHLFASDRDKGAIEITLANAERAGVTGAITSEAAAFSATNWFDDLSQTPSNLLICSNLPYGRRLIFSKSKSNQGSSRQRQKQYFPFYQKLLHHVKRVFEHKPPAAAMFLVSEPALLMQSNEHPTKLQPILKTTHGGIPVTGLYMATPGTEAAPKHDTMEKSASEVSVDCVAVE